MNQILSVEMKKQTKKNAPKVQIEMKKIMIFFVVILIMFGLVLAGKSIFSMLSDNNSKTTADDGKPNITTSRQDNQLIITITHKKEITKVSYNWNDGENKEIPGDGSNYLETTIEVPSGNNILNITTTDIEGNESTYSKEFIADPTEPQLTLEEAGTKIKIKAKDNEQLTLITYRWDEDEEQQIEIPENSSAQIETEIEIKPGIHELVVVVANSKGKQVTKTLEVRAITEPEVSIEVDPTDKSIVIMTAIDKVSLMKEMIIYVNDQGGKVLETQDEGTKIQFRYQVQPGYNKIKVIGRNNDGLEKVEEAEYNYIAD